MNSKALADGIAKSGYLLEWRVAQIFYSLGTFSVEQNLLLETQIPSESIPERLIEIDVLGTLARKSEPFDDRYIVECKGSSGSDKLVLLPTSKRNLSLPSVYFGPDTVTLNGNKVFMCDSMSRDLPPCCHTGDFFTIKEGKKEFSKANREDDRNNLYKGIIQLYSAMDAVFLEYRRTPFRAFPVIVTNVEIHVAEFDLSAPPEKRITTRIVPWAAYLNPMIYRDQNGSKIGKHDWKFIGDSETKHFVFERRIPAIWIVNIESLREFIVSDSKTFPRFAGVT